MDAKSMETTAAILEKAQQRADEMELPYKGALLPAEAYQVLQESAGAQLVDIRTHAELDWVGRIPDAKEIELRSYPGMQPNADFLAQLNRQVDKSLPVLFICRSGSRSNQAAIMATQTGFNNCYNILEGFEGDRDESGHRGQVGGWKAAGLPWIQS
jgi:rhodanese-related sulfurtransferase